MTLFSQFSSPYPGLRSFKKEEWPIFFGRESMIDNIIDKLAERQLVFVHGSSGCGKSSLIRAGVLPRLEQEHSLHGVNWRTATMRPGSSPLWNLAYAVARIVDNIKEDAEPDFKTVRIIRKLLNRGDEAFTSIQQRFEFGKNCNVCILFDQFEEIFRYAREIGREEIEILIDILRSFEFEKDNNRITLQGIHSIVTMRSDHLGECGYFFGFAELVNDTQYLLPRISDEGLIRAIREPARLFGGDVESSLIIQLVDESRFEVDALPLVQHALMRLWQKTLDAQSSQILTHQTKISLNANKSVSTVLKAAKYRGLQRLLSEHADEVLKELRDKDPEFERITEYIFRALSEIDGEGRGIRRPQRFRELSTLSKGNRKKVDKVIARFSRSDCGFLFRATGDNPVIDISHEALLRCWEKLNNQSINVTTGQPKGWIYQEKLDGNKWRAALLILDEPKQQLNRMLYILDNNIENITDHDLWYFQYYYQFLKILKRAISTKLFNYINTLIYGRLSKNTFSDAWFEQLPGESWAERYGGSWKEIKENINKRQKISKIKNFLIGSLVILLFYLMFLGLLHAGIAKLTLN